MSPAEVGSRARDKAVQLAWRRHQVRPGVTPPAVPPVDVTRACPLPIPDAAREAVPARASERLVELANRLLDGQWTALGVTRKDLRSPDWFLDPSSGRRAPQDGYSFSINHRSQDEVGDIKQVWELSRHHHLTVLAAAWFLTRDERYAERAARHLQSWWDDNPFLSGVHWISGIELGIRLISWTWVRRLLNEWSPIAGVFERNDSAVRQLHWHQRFLATFRSRGSSANNHVIAEAAGQVVASCGLPWFAESDTWRQSASALLERELARNTFASGVNREMATAYHGFVAELGVLAALEARRAGAPVSEGTWSLLGRMFDVAASLVDVQLRPPRQGDSDDGQTLVVDGHEIGDWSSLLATGAATFGPGPWWPAVSGDVRSTLLTAIGDDIPVVEGRPVTRQSHFADAGITLLRTRAGDRPEIWCRCDAGPHGFLAIAAHAHADALAVEVRHDGVDLLADPGTYCYHGEPEWRSYFRSTAGHNTLEVSRCDQARRGGPFLWSEHPKSHVLDFALDTAGGSQSWVAEHDGYRGLDPPARHRRTVMLDAAAKELRVSDRLVSDGSHPCRLAFHLGPTVDVTLEETVARLRWPTPDDACEASLALPSRLEWTLLSASTDPIAGWYSPRFGVKQPAASLIGTGAVAGSDELVTVLKFAVRTVEVPMPPTEDMGTVR